LLGPYIILCPIQNSLICRTEIGDNEVKKWAPISSRVSWNYRKLSLPLGLKKVHEPSIATAFVIPLAMGWSMEDGWIRAAGVPRRM